MSNMSEDIQYAGSDIRPSWQQRIRLYCLGKDNGENIMKSITKGPFKMGTFIYIPVEETEGALQPGPERARVFTDLSAEEKERYKADIRATNIFQKESPVYHEPSVASVVSASVVDRSIGIDNPHLSLGSQADLWCIEHLRYYFLGCLAPITGANPL
ncbi:hypothetical protein Tco_1191260 [Tanacetum coccineum]